MNNPLTDYHHRKLEERLHEERERVRELVGALCEITTWARDIAGDCDDEQQRENEWNMIERMDALLAKLKPENANATNGNPDPSDT